MAGLVAAAETEMIGEGIQDFRAASQSAVDLLAKLHKLVNELNAGRHITVEIAGLKFVIRLEAH